MVPGELMVVSRWRWLWYRVHWKLEAVATVDAVGKILAANDNFLPLFGYRKEDLLGMSRASLRGSGGRTITTYNRPGVFARRSLQPLPGDSWLMRCAVWWCGGLTAGQNVNILMPSPYHEHHHEYMNRYLQTREPRILGKGKRMVHAKHKDGYVRVPWTLGPGGLAGTSLRS